MLQGIVQTLTSPSKTNHCTGVSCSNSPPTTADEDDDDDDDDDENEAK
jgi:hypothetical protein